MAAIAIKPSQLAGALRAEARFVRGAIRHKDQMEQLGRKPHAAARLLAKLAPGGITTSTVHHKEG